MSEETFKKEDDWSNFSEEDVQDILAHPIWDDFCGDEQRSALEDPELHKVIGKHFRLRHFQKDEVIIRQDDYGNSAFIVLEGNVRVVLKELNPAYLGKEPPQKLSFFESFSQLWSNNNIPEYRNYSEPDSIRNIRQQDQVHNVALHDLDKVLGADGSVELGERELFGELSAIGRTPRTATVVASSQDAMLLEIRWQGIRYMRNSIPHFKKSIDERYRKNALLSHLNTNEILKELDDEVLTKLCDSTRFESIGKFDWYASYKRMMDLSAEEKIKNEPIIVTEGDYVNGLILVRSGFCRISRRYNYGEMTEAYLSKNELFGLAEYVYNVEKGELLPHQFNLRAIGHADILVIPGDVVEKEIIPNLHPRVKASLIQSIEDVKRLKVAEQARKLLPLPQGFQEFLVERRYINGSASMLIDLNRCTGCDDCVTACSNGHNNNPRFIRQGMVHENIMVANACMHCLDPVCMIPCPTGAINRNKVEGQITINDDTCIGCASCAESCPYDNIQMVPIKDKVGSLIQKNDGSIALKATKCDLCASQLGGPACERACPHDALQRFDMRDSKSLSKWLKR